MSKLLKYLKAYRLKAILAPFFKMLEACFELMVPLVMVRLIDVGISQSDIAAILKYGVILIMLTIIGYAASITAQYFAARAAIGFGQELRNDLYRHINTLSYREIEDLGTSSLITRMTSDMNQTVSGVNMFLRLFLRSPFIVFGAVIMAFTVDAPTAIVFLIVLPLLIIVVFSITFATIPMYRKLQDKLDRVTLLTREGLIGIRVIRAFNRQKIEEKEYREAAVDLMESQLTVGRISALMNPVTYLIVNLGIAVLIYVGAIKVDTGDLTQGQIVALVNYMSQILIELVKLANLIITLTKGLASARRISEVIEMEPSLVYGEKNIEKSEKLNITFDHVSMSYKDSKEYAVEDISFTAKTGETIGIIGGTGSGKSTLVNLIPRFYDVSDGTVFINGVDIKEYTKDAVRNMVGMVPQQSVLFKGTIADNLRMANENATDSEMYRALDHAQAREFVDSKSEGLDFSVLQGGKNLSGGQRQRLCIARALVKKPEILILDDSSSALDFATEAKLKKSLQNGAQDRITFIVSQRPSSVMNADQIIVMDDGKVVAHGTHKEVYKDCDIYREIYHTQFKEIEEVSS